jgi:hypothetical protein
MAALRRIRVGENLENPFVGKPFQITKPQVVIAAARMVGD